MAPTGYFWGPKYLLNFPVCSSWHRQGTFHIWCLHTEGIDLRIFVVEAKLNNLTHTFAPRKIQLTVVSHTQSGKAEDAKGDVNPPHIPEPWSCYSSLHLPGSHYPSAYTGGAHLLFHRVPVRGPVLCYYNNCSAASGLSPSRAHHLHDCPQGLCLKLAP